MASFSKLILIFSILVGAGSCNLFGFISGCSGDEQCLSQAKSCFDRRDFDCAEESYNKLSSALSDEKNAGLAYIDLERASAGMNKIMAGVGLEGGETGEMFTAIANAIGQSAPSTTRRAYIYAAFRRATDTTFTDASLQDFIQMVSALSLFTHLLAEFADTVGDADDLQKTYFCTSFVANACAGATAAASSITGNTFDLTNEAAADARIDDSVDFGQMDAAFVAFQDAANALNLGGGFGEGLDEAANLGATDPTTANTYVQFLTQSGTGIGLGAE